MGGIHKPTLSIDLNTRLGASVARVLVEVARAAPDSAGGRLIVSAFHRPPNEAWHWPNLAPGPEPRDPPPARKEARRG
jgi:hypothetical protein